MSCMHISYSKFANRKKHPLNGQWNILLEGLNRFHGANLSLSSDVGQDTYMFDLHERPQAYQCIISKNI